MSPTNPGPRACSPCSREFELLDALGAGFVGDELESHIATCAACRELRLVAGALLDERVQAAAEADLPGSGTMLWRMQMRRRQEAQAAARRSLLIGQAVTLAAALVLVFVLLGSHLAGEAVNVIASIRLSPPLLLAVAVWLLAVPIAGWVLLRQK